MSGKTWTRPEETEGGKAVNGMYFLRFGKAIDTYTPLYFCLKFIYLNIFKNVYTHVLICHVALHGFLQPPSDYRSFAVFASYLVFTSCEIVIASKTNKDSRMQKFLL